MSAGICIMNKNAVALAADSAVTIGSHLAVHNSANKLFALSNYEPVGLIIYASANLMGVPFEIIVKEYKKALGRKSFEKLEDYVNDFISFIESNTKYFRFNLNEESGVLNIVNDFCKMVIQDYEKDIEEKIKKVNRKLKKDEIKSINELTLKRVEEFKNNTESLDKTESISKYIKNKYNDIINNQVQKRFTFFTKTQKKSILNTIFYLFDLDYFGSQKIGIAVSGYGKSEIYPTLIHLNIGNIINEKLRYKIKKKVEINEKNQALIEPLAQTDVMETFIFGINDSYLNSISNELSNQIENNINGLDENIFDLEKKELIKNKLSSLSVNVVNSIVKKAAFDYMYPINTSISTLPIEELALLAESMINITSIKRQVVIDQNIGTVGGPIDLAIISKCDGFIWIKRKLYFDSKLNPQFLIKKFLGSDE